MPLPPGQWKALYWLAAEMGVRAGQLCAFYVQDLDLERSVIQVQRNVWRDTFQTPKTANAIRTIVLSQALTEHLREYLRTWRPNPLNLLFRIYHRRSAVSMLGAVRRFCKGLGISAKGLKAFRHCSATLMGQAGIPMNTRQERLGLAPGTKVTMVHYTHTVSAGARLAATAVGSLLVNLNFGPNWTQVYRKQRPIWSHNESNLPKVRPWRDDVPASEGFH